MLDDVLVSKTSLESNFTNCRLPAVRCSPLIKCLKQKCWIAESTLLYAPVYLCSGAKPTNRGCFKLTWISRYFLTYINIYCLHIYFIRSVPASNWGKNGRYKNNEDRENIMRCFIHCCHGNGGWALAPLSPECSQPGRVKCECWRQFFTQHSLLKFDPAAQPIPPNC